MITPIDFSRLQSALASPRNLTELAITLVCLAIAWAIERRIERADRARLEAEIAAGARQAPGARLRGVALRLAFPLIGLVLVYFAASIWRRHVGAPFFLAIATPLLVTLAGIRMLVYALRRLFPGAAWQHATELAVVAAAWLLAILYFLGVLGELGAALADIVIPIGNAQVSMLTIVEGVIVVIVALIIALWVSGLAERRLARASQIDPNLRVVFASIIRITLVVIGVLIALEVVGFDLTLLTVFGGALAVGIGLGLQKLAANYIAGFTILLDKSVRLGDLVTVDGRTGIVSQVTSRYVVVRSLDGLEAIVPNETMVTTTVLNHGYTTPGIRVGIGVQVGYGCDVERALALLVEIAKRQPRVLGGTRAPQSFVTGFADNGINLELGVWINDPQNGQLNLKSAIHRDILAEFAKSGIEIPYPRREVRIVGSVPAPATPGSPGSPGSQPAGSS
ncbi:MAG: mechanosensitive ion channel [Proteobacteria bacterium]|nr:mechanosensitive ion channel [Pseudomonadota bacterium]